MVGTELAGVVQQLHSPHGDDADEACYTASINHEDLAQLSNLVIRQRYITQFTEFDPHQRAAATGVPIVFRCTPDCQVARPVVNCCIFLLVYQHDIGCERINTHYINTTEILDSLAVVLLVGITVNPSELLARGKATVE